ncbi:MAG: hypothetical protein ACXWYS_06135 [Gaiellaceae bacterium]
MQPGAIYGEAWDLYKRFWKHFVPMALIIFVVVSAASLVLVLLLGWIGAIIGFLLSLAGTFWLQGAIAESVADVRDGRVDLSIGETLKKVRPLVPRLVGAGLLAALGIIGGLILLIVPGLLLLTWWVLISPVIVLENRGAIDAFGRSRELVRGHGWNVFGTILIGIAIGIAASIVASLALIWLPSELQDFLSSLISNSVIGPFIAAAWTLMYFQLRGEPEPAATPEPVLAGPTPGT